MECRSANNGCVHDEWLNLEFGMRLRELRGKANLSQEALAEAASLSRTSIVNIEQGRQGVSLGTLYRLAEALTCAAADLLPDAPDTPVPRIAIGDTSAESKRAVRLVMQADREDTE